LWFRTSKFKKLLFLIQAQRDIYKKRYVYIQVQRDGNRMTIAQSKKVSQRTADNVQWEDRQLLRSGAVRGTEIKTEFDDEEEHKVTLLVHGK
jgi:hypothetical protein